jgi:pyridoxamine 5'-phosphate oxidase
MKLDSIRRDYQLADLSEEKVDKNPFRQFEKWMKEALEAKVNEPTAMGLSAVAGDGFPHTRIVLLKDFGEEGFTFFTNYNSLKGQSIAKNPAVSLLFFWPELERQIRIAGLAEKTGPEVSDRYFYSRPLNSQVAAAVSEQSSEIHSREKLDQLFEARKHESVTRPENWGGFLVKPVRFEFWQGRESRLHDRILFEKKGDNWQISRLAP